MEHIDWYRNQPPSLQTSPSPPPPPFLSSKKDVWVWIIDSDTCYMLLGVIICSGECHAARYETDTAGIKRHNQDLKTAALPKITRPLAARRMLPKSWLHLFMTRALVIPRLNYRTGVKINSSTGGFAIVFCVSFVFPFFFLPWSRMRRWMYIGASILHTD